jgi:hypothetical protein
MPIRLECCNAHVILNRSPCGRRFFAHRNQPPECNWKPESIEHIELKAVVDDAVNATPGWSAEQEKLGPNWQADVLAIRGKMKIAFEIQVSGQGQLKTALREDRYETADVLPWWLVTARNAGDGFGSQLRTQLRGTSLEEKCRSAERAVPEILRRVESQVRIAEAIVLHLRAKGVPYRLTKFCNVPVLFELEVGGKTQSIVVGELGADTVPGYLELRKRSPDEPWGTVVQFVRNTKRVAGFGSPAFFVKRDPAREVPPILDRLLRGAQVWRGRQHDDLIEAALIWYQEQCGGCGKPFARAPYAIAGHLHRWSQHAPKLIQFGTSKAIPWTLAAARQFEERTKLRLGKIWQPQDNKLWRRVHSPSGQACPHCSHSHLDSLISRDDALRFWPHRDIDWHVPTPRADLDSRWVKSTAPAARELHPMSEWSALLINARRRGAEAETAERLKRQQDEIGMNQVDEWLRNR